ncbi:MAG: hypothetical protein MK193_01790 [Lentisphaeria bacterium]|nr:hypothetical protein [Lentisphaeria bacterium]
MDQKYKPNKSKILLIAFVLQGLILCLFFFVEPLRKSSMSYNPKEAEAKADNVKQANQKRKEEEKKRREHTTIPEDQAEKLKEKARKKEKKKIEKKLAEMRDIKKELEKKKIEKLHALRERPQRDIKTSNFNELMSAAEEMKENAYHLMVRTGGTVERKVFDDCEKLIKEISVYTQTGTQADIPQLVQSVHSIQEKVNQQSAQANKVKSPQLNNYHIFGSGILHHSNVLLKLLNESSLSPEQQEQIANIPDEFLEEDLQQDLPNIEEMSFEKVLEEVKELEADINQDFNELRAAEIAEIHQTAFTEALEKVTNLTRQNQQAQAQQGQQNQQAQAQQGQQNQQAQAQQGQQNQHGQGKPTVGKLNAYRQRIQDQARQASLSHTQAQMIAQKAGIAGGGKKGMGQSLSQSSAQGSGSQSQSKGGGKHGGSGGSNRNQKGSKSGDDMSDTGRNNVSGIRIPEELVKAQAMPGRKFQKSSKRQGWLYIDTWYIIGPWENHGRMNYQVAHPPEISVDLEAEYKNGKTDPKTNTPRALKWKFVQSNQMKIKPPIEQADSTYFCVTEVYFEEAQEMLVAIASDDAARMWVNKKVIWEDRGMSGWNLQEGFRRIKFNEGFNQILVRLENKPQLCEFSVLLCPTKEEQ